MKPSKALRDLLYQMIGDVCDDLAEEWDERKK